MKCPRCKEKFPERLITQMFLDGEYLTVCPLCALAITNRVHGLPVGTPFRGEIASAMYDEALQILSNRTS